MVSLDLYFCFVRGVVSLIYFSYKCKYFYIRKVALNCLILHLQVYCIFVSFFILIKFEAVIEDLKKKKKKEIPTVSVDVAKDFPKSLETYNFTTWAVPIFLINVLVRPKAKGFRGVLVKRHFFSVLFNLLLLLFSHLKWGCGERSG